MGKTGKDVCQSGYPETEKPEPPDGGGDPGRGHSRIHSESAECDRLCDPESLYCRFWCCGCGGQKLHSIPMQMVFGFTQGIMPLVSYTYASGNRERMKKSILFSLGLIVPVMTAVTVGYWAFSPQLVRMFMNNPEVMLYGPRLLRGLCLSLLLLSIDFMAISVFQALGRGRYSLLFAVMRKLLLEIPLLFILNALFPLYGLAYAQPCAEVVLAIAAIIMLLRIFREGQTDKEV